MLWWHLLWQHLRRQLLWQQLLWRQLLWRQLLWRHLLWWHLLWHGLCLRLVTHERLKRHHALVPTWRTCLAVTVSRTVDNVMMLWSLLRGEALRAQYHWRLLLRRPIWRRWVSCVELLRLSASLRRELLHLWRQSLDSLWLIHHCRPCRHGRCVLFLLFFVLPFSLLVIVMTELTVVPVGAATPWEEAAPLAGAFLVAI